MLLESIRFSKYNFIISYAIQLNFFLRADAARQKSEALRNLATQLIEEHADYTKKNEQVK